MFKPAVAASRTSGGRPAASRGRPSPSGRGPRRFWVRCADGGSATAAVADPRCRCRRPRSARAAVPWWPTAVVAAPAGIEKGPPGGAADAAAPPRLPVASVRMSACPPARRRRRRLPRLPPLPRRPSSNNHLEAVRRRTDNGHKVRPVLDLLPLNVARQ